jgi:hypothetical protein
VQLFPPAPLRSHATAGAGTGFAPCRDYQGVQLAVTHMETRTRKDNLDRVVPVIWTFVVGHFSRNLAAPGASGRYTSTVSVPGGLGSLGPHLFQEELTKVEVGHVAPVACTVQGRSTVWDQFSVDVGAVFNKLFWKNGRETKCLKRRIRKLLVEGLGSTILERSSRHRKGFRCR